MNSALEALGTVMYWGLTPSINCFSGTNVKADDKPINVLMSETGGDCRHLLKSVSDLLPMTARKHPIHIYFHERQKENLARLVLLLTLICETGLSIRERMEMFLDLYGNCLIRDRTQSYLDEISRELI